MDDKQISLLWNVESITDSFFSPMTSSFSIGGQSYVYKYVFDRNGKIISQEKTGDIVQFRKQKARSPVLFEFEMYIFLYMFP